MGEEAKHTQSASVYGQPKSFDVNRVLNAVALWSLIIFWVWTCFYWILQYAPMPLIHEPGSKNNEYKYTDVVVGAIKDAMCPTNKGSPISYCVWYYPAFISFTIVALVVRKHGFYPHKPKYLAGDMDFVLFSYIAIAIPLLIFFSFYMYKKWPSGGKEAFEGTQSEWVAKTAGTFANRIGFVGFWFLTFFMIPATRHGPVLAAMGWHPYHACTIHMFCGWGSFWTSWMHFICYIIKYAVTEYDEPTKSWMYIFPPTYCWTWNTKDNGAINATTGEQLMSDDGMPEPPENYGICGKAMAGFYGTCSILFFTILAITSMQVVRRFKYQVFYFSHIICAPLFILFVSMHWRLTYQYFWPSCFYYFATQAPFLLQHSRKTINNYGLKITGVMDIPCRQSPKKKEGQEEPAPPQRSLIERIFNPESIDWLDEQVNLRGPQAKSIEHCVSFDFAVTEEGFEQFYPGMYGNIWCPDASMKSHPFSVTHVPGRTDQLRIIFRVFGRWTDLLARSLIQLPCPGHQQEFLPIPKIMMDGWHGPNHLVGSAFDHDKAVIVTAGIGITAFLSMFTELIEILCFNEDGMFIKLNEIKGVPLTKEFALHWTCRDENLIKYITDEYFQPLMEKSKSKYGKDFENHNGVRCHIHIHRTGPAGQKTINPSSLWMSFRDKTERGINEIEFGLLGTFGTPWSPYRFSFGRWSSLMQHIPSIGVFCSIFWISYFFSIKVHFWILNNPFGLPKALEYFQRILDFLPTLIVSFGIGWIAHVGMDWTENIHSSKRNASGYTKTTHKTVDEEFGCEENSDMNFVKSLIAPETSDEYGKEEQPEQQCHHEASMISLHSTAGRPSFDELIEASEVADYDSTAIYLCGPEMMIKSCKQAAGMGCQYAAERIQMAMNNNKFVFYEEKFEW